MLPLDFINNMSEQLGTELDAFCRALTTESVVSVRLNDKLPLSDLSDITPVLGDRVPWASNAYYLKERVQFTLDPLFHAGCYYVQDASSMFIEQVLKQYVSRNAIVLDLCAAPGGKATLISQYLRGEGLLVANEVVRQRVFILSENIQKWGNGNVVVTHNQPAAFAAHLPFSFDCMLVDAPCSGEGMFRKDQQAQDEWSMQNVEMCAKRQKSILKDAWGALRPGGVLIYSTCTFNRLENEEIAQYAMQELGADLLPVNIDPSWGITETTGYHFYPHKVKGEGLYVCVMRKKEVPYINPNHRGSKRNKPSSKPSGDIFAVRQWLQNPDDWAIRQTERFTTAYPMPHKDLIEHISQSMTCISTGFGLSELRGRAPAPQHSLSMAKDFNTKAFQQVELSKETALAYLRQEAIILDNQPIGLLLVTYHGIPLGFAKNIGNHCNNLYPSEWRIRMQIK